MSEDADGQSPSCASVELALAVFDLVESADLASEYCERNGIDPAAIQSATRGVFVSPVRPIGLASFEPDVSGSPAAWCEALDEGGETTVDVVAWSTTDPTRVRTLYGRTPVLGVAVGANPASAFGGRPLRVFRTPLAWLQAGCDGVAILDETRAARWLLELGVDRLAPEDDQHARAIDRALHRLVEGVELLVPVQRSSPRRLKAA